MPSQQPRQKLRGTSRWEDSTWRQASYQTPSHISTQLLVRIIDNRPFLIFNLISGADIYNQFPVIHFSEGDPSNYLTLFKRGTVYFALGKARNSLSDFSQVLELKPDFTTARAQRGIVHLKLGDFDKAELDFHKSLMEDPYNDDVNYLYSKVDPAREQWNSIENLIARGDHRTAIAFLTQLLEISPWSAKFRETRADCYINENDVLSAVSDLRSVNRLSQDSTGGSVSS